MIQIQDAPLLVLLVGLKKNDNVLLVGGITHLQGIPTSQHADFVYAPCEALWVTYTVTVCEEDVRIVFANVKHPLRNRDVHIISDISTTLME